MGRRARGDPCSGLCTQISRPVFFQVRSPPLSPIPFSHQTHTSQTYLEYLDQTAATCNYTNYVSTYVKYPPEGLLPLPGDSVEFADGCDVWDDIFNNALIINPAFDIYRIWDTASHDRVIDRRKTNTEQYPILWDVLGFPYALLTLPSPFSYSRGI